MSSVPAQRPPRAIAWTWTNAAHGAVLAIPAMATTAFDPSVGLPLAVGVIPAAAVGIRGPRRGRWIVVLVGAIAGINLAIGSLVAPYPIIAVVTIFGLCVLISTLVADPRRKIAPLILSLGVPLVGVGLSETPATGAAAGVLIVAGSVYGWLVSLIWPNRPAQKPPARTALPRRTMVLYGVQIGLAGAVGASLGFALGVDHPGWACAAALLISRPDRRLLDARVVGRVLSVLVGAIAACLLVAVQPPPGVLALLALLLVAGSAATSGSRWYVLPFFTTTLVLSMLMLDETEPAAHWFLERVLLTLAGAALAWLAAASIRGLTRIPPGGAE